MDSSGADRYDARSDITQCVGLLYYLVAKREPGIIYDRNRKKPHERNDLDKDVVDKEPSRLRVLRRIFDIGFEHEPDRRWQSIESLAQQLKRLESGADVEKVDFNARLKEMHRQILSEPVV